MRTKAHLTDQVTPLEQKNRALSYEAATEGIVLLSNDGVLPLQPCPVALYGSGVQNTIKGGSGSGEVNVRHTVTVQEGLEKAGFETLTGDWLARYDRSWKAGKEQFLRTYRRKMLRPSTDLLNELMEAEYRFPSGDVLRADELEACPTDTCIYVVSRQSGEGHDREDTAGSFRLDSTEEANIRLCAAHFAQFILIINAGAPIDLSPLDDIQGIRAVVYMGQLGMEGGHALAAMLTGQCTPSGKLAVSWPQRYSDVPWGEEFSRNPEKAWYREGIYVGYRYYDSFDVAPRYPFGFGLSYTSFIITHERTILKKETVTCTVRVTNSGSRYAGKEIVQVYVRCPGSDCEYQRLVAFGKTELLTPGCSQTLTLTFPVSALSHYDEAESVTYIASGRHLLQIGGSSRETEPVAVLDIPDRIVLSRHRPLCAADRPVSELRHSNTFTVPEGLPVLSVSPDDFTPRTFDYNVPDSLLSSNAAEAMNRLSIADRLRFCAGTGFKGEPKGFCTPGAVGHTTADYTALGIPNVELCDGPAGIRLERRAVQYPNGTIRALDVSISVYEFFPDWLLRLLVLGNPKKGQVLYQFVTGFPIEAVVAQTWNTSLAERIGRAVSEEMSEYGVTFWLSPALNIVRNPLCGRNFEYYSEDPFISGQMAAATTRGVQSVKGNYVTAKHFCANNQESYRHTVSSEVDERALREIYWKGFEMTVSESQPKAIMSAYNKLNGTYCSNHRELCTDLLRGEWAFDGIVMTDWYATGEDRADEVKALQAGVDLLMPGGKNVVKILAKAIAQGQLDEAAITRACRRVLHWIVP